MSCFAHLEFIFVVNSRMSERSIYLRDEAAKCRWHADRMTELYGAIHVLIANAAVLGPIGPFVEHRPRDWQEVFETNVIGVMNACLTVLPQMIQRRSGKILVIADSSSSSPRPNFAPFSASKAEALCP